MTLAEDTQMTGIIFRLVKSAIRGLTGDKTVGNTFCANIASYVDQNAQSFIDHYGEISVDTLTLWLTEFPIETIQ